LHNIAKILQVPATILEVLKGLAKVNKDRCAGFCVAKRG